MTPLAAALQLATEPAQPTGEEHPALPARLQAYSRYVAVIAEGLDALQRRDLPRLQDLAEERRRLERELAAAPGGPSPSPAPPASDFHALLERGLKELSNEAELDEWERKRWEWLQDGALLAARGLNLRPVHRGDYRGAPAAENRLDVRF